MKNVVLMLTVMYAMLVFALPAVEAEEGPRVEALEQPAATREAQPTAGVDAMVVFIDPETGKVTSTPNAEQRAAMRAQLANMLSQSDEGLVDEYLPNGAVLRDLQGRFQSATIVRIAPDGSQHIECTTSADQVLSAEVQPKDEVASASGQAK